MAQEMDADLLKAKELKSMKKKMILVLVCCMVFGLTACGEKSENETVTEGQTEPAPVVQMTPVMEAVEKTAGTDEEDLATQIRTEIDGIAAGVTALSDELARVNELYEKYDGLRQNAANQTEMNSMCKWGTEVWKDETLSLLDRIKKLYPEKYDEIRSEYEKWEGYVPTMAERMSYKYEDGSIYPTVYAYNEAMRYKSKAYSLASTLADLSGDTDLHFPDHTRCGYYGDYAGDSYLIITEGMESGTYDILIHIDDEKELRGWGMVEDAPDSDTYLLFTSDDDSVKAYVSHSSLEASLYVKETDYSVIGPEGAYTFSNKY